jgi:hypothetical protein
MSTQEKEELAVQNLINDRGCMAIVHVTNVKNSKTFKSD